MRVSVVGAGRLGLPLSCILSRAGHDVIAADVNESVVKSINEGICPIEETNLDNLFQQSKITATTDITEATKLTEITFIVVPTPSGRTNEFSNDAVLAALEQIGNGIKQKVSEHTVIVTSTVMPGASQNDLIPALEKASGRTVGNLLNFAYSPEFIALGSVIQDMYHPDFILIGEANKRAGAILSHICSTYITDEIQIHRISPLNAEIAKLSLNCFLTVKISFANMIAEFCESFEGGDADQVCEVIGSDSRIGAKYLKPATASGGTCLPRDLRALDAAMGKREIQDELVEAAMSINDRQVSRLRTMVTKFAPRKVAVLGLSYKPNTAITEASPGLDLVKELTRLGRYEIATYDPSTGQEGAGPTITGADVVVIMTAWPEFAELDYGDAIVIDCWGIAQKGSNIRRIGRG